MHKVDFLQSSLVRYTHTATRNGSSSGHLGLREDVHGLDSLAHIYKGHHR